MMVQQAQMLPGPDTVQPKRFWYEGTDTIYPGYALCRNADYGTAATAEPSRGIRVEKPAAGNLHNFVGVVAPGRPGGYTGPIEVEVIVPSANGVMASVYTTEACTLGTTVLSVVAASYFIGGIGEGMPIGVAYQTVDRSTDNGQVIANLLGIQREDQLDLAPDAGPSRGVWESCPWNMMLNNPGLGVTFFEDFMQNIQGGATGGVTGTSTTEVREWIQTEVTSGLTAPVETAGGELLVSSEAFAGADDGLTVMYRDTAWTPTDTKRIWFEARVKMNNVVTPDQYAIGLFNTINDALPSGVIDDTVDKIAFYTHSGTTTLTMEFITAKTTVQEQTTAAAVVANDTYIRLGFIADLASVTPYVNGTAGTAHVTAAKLPTAATGLGILMAACVDQTSTVANMTVDWIRIAQLR